MNITPHDLFCAAALQGLLAGRNPQAAAYNTAEVAKVAVECADQMLLVLAGNSNVIPANHLSSPVEESTKTQIPSNVVELKRDTNRTPQ